MIFGFFATLYAPSLLGLSLVELLSGFVFHELSKILLYLPFF